MKVAITGATGFVGRVLVKKLWKKHELVPISRRLGHDISKKESIEAKLKDVDVIVHLAVESRHFAPWKKHYLSTVLGTKNVVEICREYGIRLVYLSSCVVKCEGFTNYVLAKRIQDKIIAENLENFVGIRPSFIYNKENLRRVFGVPMVPRDVLITPAYLGTVVEAIEKALKRGQGIYELGDRKAYRISEIIEAVTGRKPLVMPKALVKSLDFALKLIDIPARTFGIRTWGLMAYLCSNRICNSERAVKELGVKQVDTIKMVKKLLAL